MKAKVLTLIFLLYASFHGQGQFHEETHTPSRRAHAAVSR